MSIDFNNLSFLQVHGKDAILSSGYDSDDSNCTITDNNVANHNNNNNNTSNLISSQAPPPQPQQPSTVSPMHSVSSNHSGLGHTSLITPTTGHSTQHLIGGHQNNHLSNHPTVTSTAAPATSSPSMDFKPQTHFDWYSHAGMMGYMKPPPPADNTSSHPHSQHLHHLHHSSGHLAPLPPHSSQSHHHVSAALPTPPSTGHSPIQSLPHNIGLLNPTTAYT